ncbi:MAG: hypothetical protein JWP97_2069 [Labilithrix sp.]|nr:hypothetical protein [Labilithrix sp.]
MTGATRGHPSYRAVALEALVVSLLLVLAGYVYLLPASAELLRGNAQVMIGDNGDSLTEPWTYQLLIDTFHAHPRELLYGAAVYSDQMNAPQGVLQYVPWMERMFVLGFSTFLRADAIPTAFVWGQMWLSGLCFYLYGRVLGWSRAVTFALAFAWAFCPYTRARGTVHIGFVATYWVPLVYTALHLLARRVRFSPRGSIAVAAGMFLFAVFAAHYYVVIAAIMAPACVWYFLRELPRGASRLGALGRLALAALPAAAFVVYSFVAPGPAWAMKRLESFPETRSETAKYLSYYGAHPLDYVLGDMKFGHHDLIPLREKLTREARKEVRVNRHERTNGIRWTVLASFLALGITLTSKRLRRGLSADERRLGGFAAVLALGAFLVALSPQGIRVYDTELGPVRWISWLLPRFRVPNRTGIVVHFAALLGAGVFLDHHLRRMLAGRDVRSFACAAALVVVMVLDYPPRYGVEMANVIPVRKDLEAAAGGGPCGAGMTVPYVTWGFHDENYYEVFTSLRRTSCQVLHGANLTVDDDVVRAALGRDLIDEPTRLEAERVARCAGASWVIFRLDAPEDLRRTFCAEMGWTFFAPDGCRAPAGTPLPGLRPLRECIAR